MEKATHDRTLANDLPLVPKRHYLLAENVVLLPESRHLQSFRHGVLELLRPHRLRDVVGRTGLDCLDGVLDRGIARDHDQGNVVCFLSQQVEELEPRHARHLEIGDDQLDLAMRQRLKSLWDIPRPNRTMACSKQSVLEQQTNRRVVVDVKDRRHCCVERLWSGR